MTPRSQEHDDMIYSRSDLVKILSDRFPNARTGVIEEVLDCLQLHSDKNNDYNGDTDLFRMLGAPGRFADVWRKVIRLFVAIVQQRKMLVPEKKLETARDLVVYSLLLSEELKHETSQ